ncbi:MAG: putative lipid flippase FtsW [Candidatus Poribacteria bacterium]|nr:putative lipid flippase FtsW [Candidatus Poribacteria bacterium]
MLYDEFEKASAKFDKYILIVVGLLLIIGILMVYSASNAFSREKLGDSLHYLKRQLIYCGLGLALMFVVMWIDYRHYQRLAWGMIAFSLILLVLIFVPGVGVKIGGSTRWIKTGNFTFQPVEIAKLALIVYMARFLSQKNDYVKSFKRGILPFLIIISVYLGLLCAQPDFGSVILIVFLAFILLFIGGARVLHLVSLGSVTIVFIVVGVLLVPYRLQRVLTFINPESDPEGTSYHIIQSLYALGSGRVLGTGLGEGVQKLHYLPTPHTDSIFSVIGEELGFVGTSILVILFMIVVWRGIRISLKTEDRFGSLLAVGISCLIGIQTIINVGVATGSLPSKGITLPFISFGGSSLVMSLIAIGVLLNISKNRVLSDND